MYRTNEVNPINEKLKILRHLCILPSDRHDEKYDQMRKILSTCKSQVEMDNKVRSLIMGKQTIEEFINQYGEK